jgi:APA family basic amino acid/polyamine antiporter
VAFGRFLGILWPTISETNYIIPPVHISEGYAISLSTTQLVGVLCIAFLTWTNTRGLQYGKIIQNIFTTSKLGTLFGIIVIGILLGWNPKAVAENFGDLWTARGVVDIVPGLTAMTAFGLFVGVCVAQTGSLFSSDAWNNITFTAGEVKEPHRNIPLSLAFGTGIVTLLYILCNVSYLVVLPLAEIQHAPADRVATAMLQAVFPGLGVVIMAVAIMISTFGCMNGLVLSGARAYYAMAKDKLFFEQARQLNHAAVPGWALVIQGVWAAFLVLPRTYDPATKAYGNLYSNLLDYVVSAALIFYILTIGGILRLRKTQPNADRPYKAFGYPIVPLLYMTGASTILGVLFVYRTSTTFPGLVIVLLGVPVYLALSRRS